VIRLISALLILWLGVAPARADELSELVDRHLQWRGGEAFAAVEALSSVGELETAGLTGEVRMLIRRDGSLRQSVDLGVVRNAEGVGPAGAWRVSESGQLEDMAADSLEDRRRDIGLALGAALRDPARLSLRPDAERDGRSWAVVAVAFGDADVHELYLDRETGALHGLRTVRDRRESFVRYDDWRMVEGVRAPFVETVFTESQPRPTVIRWREIDVNPPVDAAAFAPPPVETRHVIAGDARSTGWIDFDFFGGNRVYIPATINGQDVDVLLDSGAEMTVLDRAFAAALGVEGAGEIAAVGTGGVAQAQFASGITLQVGPLTLRDMTVAILDLEAIAGMLGRPLPVILGKDAFADLIVDVDFPNRRIAFHEPSGFAPPAGAREVALVESAGGLRSVEVSIEGRPPAPFDFDIGNGGSALVFPAYAEAEGLLEGRRSSTVLSGAVGGLRTARIAVVERLTFAGVELRDVPVVFTPAGTSAVDSDRLAGNLGIGVLARFRLITDYPGDRLWLVPDAAALAAPFPRDRLGLSLRKEGDVVVAGLIAEGSPAEAAGWTAPTRIVAIDGQPAGSLTAEALREIVTAPAGRRVSFTLDTGETRVLEARDYF